MSAEALAVGTMLVDGGRVASLTWTGDCWLATLGNGAVYDQPNFPSGLYGYDGGRIPWPPPPLKPGDVVSVEGRVVEVTDDGTARLTRIKGSASDGLDFRVFAVEDVTFVRHGQPGEPYVESEVLAVGQTGITMDGQTIVDMVYGERAGWIAVFGGGDAHTQRRFPDGLSTLHRPHRLPWPPKPEAAS